jgi:signal transduction histidine kinase
MFNPSFLKQPMPSSAENSSDPSVQSAPLLQAGVMMANRGIYGVVWFDADTIVTARYGRLVDFVEIGEAVWESVPALAGLDDELNNLRENPAKVIDLPSISIVRSSDDATPRANLTVIWDPEHNLFLLLIGRSQSRSDLEVELSRQMRARLIAEAEVTAKSKELARSNSELARANSDLESYASIISHDLKAPMRGLRYLVDDLEAELGSSVAPAIQQKFDSLREQSRRMSGMLTALLDYSSAARRSEMLEEVDTAGLVRSVVASIPRPENFKITVSGGWPQITTLTAPLDLVLRNLLENAVKHHDRDDGTVQLTAEARDDGLYIEVRDDGPGIAPEYHRAVFQPFLKLDASRSTDGQGMGLALVRKTVESVGGSLSLSSNAPVSRGTVFTVFWPTRLTV